MKFTRLAFAGVVAACCMTGAAWAADVSPVGTWTHYKGTPGLQTTLVIENVDGKLSGTLRRDEFPPFVRADVGNSNSYRELDPVREQTTNVEPIFDVTMAEGVITFKTKRTFGGQNYATTYVGKLRGTSIQFTVTTTSAPDKDGRARKPGITTLVMKRAK